MTTSAAAGLSTQRHRAALKSFCEQGVCRIEDHGAQADAYVRTAGVEAGGAAVLGPVSPADRGTTGWSVVIDVAVVAMGGVLVLFGAIAGGFNTAAKVVLPLLALGALGAAWWWARWRTGRSVGHRLLGLRTVGDDSLMPAAPRWRGRGRRTLDVRRGVDPLRLFARPVSVPVAPSRRRQKLGTISAIVSDDGARHPITGRTLIGRDGQALHERGESFVALPDFGHTLEPVHAAVVPVSEGVEITPISDGHPTLVDRGWEQDSVSLGSTATVPFGSGFLLGDRRFSVARDEGGEAA